MALVIDLKPSERIIIGNALITNDDTRTRLHIQGDAPILREKDIMREEDANSPGKRVYLTVQLMYLSKDPAALHDLYFKQVREIQDAAPSTTMFLVTISEHILNNNYYKALKAARNLIEYEQELLSRVS